MLRKSLPSIIFLALFVPPLAALEESLVGTWEASGDDGYGAPFTTRLVFLEDGTFEFSSVRTEEYARLHAVFSKDAEVSVADVKTLIQLYREALPETPLDARSILGSGTYTAFGDSLRLKWVSLRLSYDDRDWAEFMNFFWAKFAFHWEAALRVLEESDLPEEDRLALEQELTAIQTTIQQETGSREPFLTLRNAPPAVYELQDDGEVLVLQGTPFSEIALLLQEAEPLAYRRIDAATPVTPATWGGVKSTLSP